MVWHILPKVPNHCTQSFVVNGNVIRVDTVDLRPPLSTRILQGELDVLERLVNLRIDFLVNDAGIWVPAAFDKSISIILFTGKELGEIPCPEHSIRSPTRTAWL